MSPTRRGRYLDANGSDEGKWSRVGYMAHDDLIAFEANALPAGGKCVVDIELTRVESTGENRLVRRYGTHARLDILGENL